MALRIQRNNVLLREPINTPVLLVFWQQSSSQRVPSRLSLLLEHASQIVMSFSFSKILTTLSILLGTFLVSITTMIQPASARIGSITAPKTPLHPGKSFNVTFHTEDYPTNNVQYYAIFGIAPPHSSAQALGHLLGTGYDLVAHGHSQTDSGTFNVLLTIPKNFKPSGRNAKYRLTAVVTGTVSIPR